MPDLDLKRVECFILERPGAGDVTFGFGARFDGDGDGEEGDGQQASDEEVGETATVEAEEMVHWNIIS